MTPDAQWCSTGWIRSHLGASARVRGVPNDGSAPLTVHFSRDTHGTIEIDGKPVDVQRSDQCR